MNYFYLEKIILSQFKTIQQKLPSINTSDNDRREVHNIFDQILKTLDKQVFKVFEEFAQDTIIQIPRISIMLQYRLERAEFYINYFEQNIQTENKFYIEIKMLHAELLGIYSREISKNADQKLQLLQQALNHIQQAVDIISKPQNQTRYQFMVYNISLTIYKLIKSFFIPSFMKQFTNVLSQIHKMLIKIDNVDHNWKGHFSWILYNCLLDSNDEKEALEILKQLQQNSDQKNYDFHDLLFKQRVNICTKFPTMIKQIEQEVNSSKNQKWKFVLKIQQFKMRQIQENQIDKEINQIIRDLNDINILENTIDTDGYHEIYTDLIRVCLYYGNTETAIQLLNALKVIKAKNYRVQFLECLINAQIILQKSVLSSHKDNYKGQNLYLKTQIQNRLEALKITQSVFRLDKYINDPWLIYEAAVQIWNICLPFMNTENQQFIQKPLSTAIEFLEKTFCHDYKLRVQMLYQLAVIDYQAKLTQKPTSSQNPLQSATLNITKAIELDNYLEESELSQKIHLLSTKIKFLKGGFDSNEWKNLIKINQEIDLLLENQNQNQQILITEVQDIFKKLSKFERYNFQNEGFQLDQNLQHFQIILNETLYKLSCMSFQESFHELLFQVADFILESEHMKDQQNQIICIKTYYLKFQGYIQWLSNNNCEYALQQSLPDTKNNKKILISEEEIDEKKELIIHSCKRGIQLAQDVKQNWLLFNGSILFWNNYLQYFKNSKFDDQLDKRIQPFLGELIDILKTCVQQEENKKFFDYEIQDKIKIYANYCIIYTRFLESENDHQKIQEICENLLQCALTDQTRKLVNSIRARVLVNTNQGNNKQTQNKQSKDTINNNNNSLQLQILVELESLQNSSKCGTDEIIEPIKNCKQLVDQWIDVQGKNANDKIKSEICTKFANFCLNQKNKKCITFALQFLQLSLDFKRDTREKKDQSIIQLICYAQFLYGKALYQLLSEYNLLQNNKDDICLKGLKFLLKSTKNSLKCKEMKTFIDSINKFYTFIDWIKNENLNDGILQVLTKPIYTLLYYTKEAREVFQDVFGRQDLQKLFVNLIHVFYTSCQLTQEWELLEKACFVLLEFLDKNFQSKIWHFLVISMTKQDKNQKQILDIIKDCYYELQAQLLVKISYYSNKPQNQYFALTKAIDILKQQQSVLIVEVLMDLSEWMFRNDYDIEKVSQNILTAIDIVIEKRFIDLEQSQENLQNEKKQQQILKLQANRNLYSFESKKNKVHQALVKNTQGQKTYILDYNIQELDKLFRLHCYLSIIQDNNKAKIKNLNFAIFFIQKIHDICQLYINNIRGKKLEEQGFSLESIFKYEKKDIFILKRKLQKNPNFAIYYKPLLTLKFLFYAIQQYQNIEYSTPLWILISYLSFFNNLIFQNLEIKTYCKIQKSILTEELNFQQEKNLQKYLQKFDFQYFKKIVEVQCRNSINSKNNCITQNKVYLLDSLDVRELWIKVSQCLIQAKNYSMAQQFLQNYQMVAQHQQQPKAELESVELQGIIYFEQKDYKRAQVQFENYLEKSKNKIYSELFFYYYFQNCRILYEEYQFLEVLNKYEQMVLQVAKNEKQNCIQMSYIYMFKCRSLLSNFRKFDNYFIIEKKENYMQNLKKVFQEVIGKLYNFKEFFLNNFSFKSLSILIELFKDFDQTLRQIKVLSFEVLEQKFLISNSFIQLLKKYIEGIQSIIIGQVLDFENVNDNHDLKYQTMLEFFYFLKVQHINEFLQLEKFHEENTIQLPFLQQKSFASLLQTYTNIDSKVSLFVIDKDQQQDLLNKNEEQWIKQNLADIQENILPQNLQKLNEQLIKIEILHSEENLALLNIDVEEDCDINDNILTLLENDKKIEYQKTKEQTQVESHQKKITQIKNLKFLYYNKFNSKDYFRYNIKRLELLIKKRKPHNCKNFIDFQSLMFQKRIYDYSLQLLNLDYHQFDNTTKHDKFNDNITTQIQDVLELKKLKQNLSNLQGDSIYFSIQFSSDLQMMYVCCFYLNQNSQIEISDCKIFSANQNFKEIEEFTNKQKTKKQKKIQQMKDQEQNADNECKSFQFKYQQQQKQDKTDKFTKQDQVYFSDTFDKYEQLDPNVHNINIISEIKNYYSIIDIQNESIKENKDLDYQDCFLPDILSKCEFKNFKEVINFLIQFINNVLVQINENIEKDYEFDNQKNKQKPETKNTFDSLCILLDTYIIDFPVELFLKNEIKQYFSSFYKDSSLQALLNKILNSQTTSVDQEKSLFLNLINKNVENVEEITLLIQQIKNLSQISLTKREDMILDIVECQNNIENKDIFSFFSNYDFFDIFPLQKFLEIQQNQKKLIQIFDRQKVFNKEYFKYIVRKKQEFDYVRSQQFYFVFTLCQAQIIIYPRFYYTQNQFQTIIENINNNIKQQQQFNECFKNFEKFIDFNVVGYPIMQYNRQNSKNNKK